MRVAHAPEQNAPLQALGVPAAQSPSSKKVDRQSIRHSESPKQAFLFKEINELRKVKEESDAEECQKYRKDFIGRLAGSHYFELLTFFFIGLNSLYIGYDADYTAKYGKPEDPYSKDMPWGFIVMENIFAVYFTVEVVIRFLAYKTKCHCFCDGWFIFDFILVVFMVLECWLFPLFGLAGPLAQFSVLRLLRLLRISRMARLMKQCPELMIIIKGLLASVRSVGCTAVLLILCLYVWSILFVAEYHEGARPEDDLGDTIHYHFGTMGRSMFSLFIMGTVLDDVTVVTNSIRETGNTFMLLLFIVFILISSFTILNMLIGILCEVVGATNERETSKAQQNSLREAFKKIFETLDKDGSGCITRDEFVQMRDDKHVKEALKEMNILERHFQKYCEILFHRHDASIDYETLMKMLLRLRPGNNISALDLSLLGASLSKGREQIRDRILRIKKMIANAIDIGSPTSATLRQDGPHSFAVASSVEARSTAKGEPPPQPPLSAESAKQYPLEMFVKISSEQIIEELERRLSV